MLSRSNFSIRRLMTQRRQNSDDNLFWDNDEKASSKVTDGRGSPSPSLKGESRKRRNSRSWMSKPSTKKIPQPIIILRSGEDLHRITHLPPLPDTPHSSKSSLCSCEQHAGFASPRHLPQSGSPGYSPGHGSIRSKTYGARRVSPPPGSPLENPRPSPRLPTDARKKSVKSLPSPTKLTFDLLEALEIQPDNEDMATPIPIMPPTPPRRKSTPTVDRDSEERSDNVQQLIREADDAFDSAGTALRLEEKPNMDTRVSEEKLINIPPPTGPPPTPPVRRRPSPLRPNITKKRLSKPALSPLKSPTISASVSKAKRQKSQKSRNGRPPRPVAKKQRLKWSVNAKDLLTVRLFNRLEVDEVLSPTRLQEIRMSGASHIQSRRSSETLRTIQSDGSDTPVDPFNLQDLPTRIGAAGVRLSIPSPIVEVPTPRTFDFNLDAERRMSPLKDEDTPRADQPSVSRPPPPEDTTPSKNLPEDEEMTCKDTLCPSLPAKNPLRFASVSHKDVSHLPSIPEVLVTTPENFTISPSTSPQPAHKATTPEADDEPFIYLPSSPYTLTMPTFRHGPIRITKADAAAAYAGSSKLAAASVLDDSLDWTAFHMAILGGAGDVYGEATDYSRRRGEGGERDEVDDLCEWFADFGFAGWGSLDRGHGDGCSPVSTRSSRSGGGGQYLPIPVEKEFASGFWHARSGDEIGGTEASRRFDRARSVGLRRWTVEGHPKRYEGTAMCIDSSRRPSVDSVASLPQSPMLDLVMSRDADGKEYIVPMGYNLSHDLGDFLSWEAENVYAAAFQGNQVEGEVELEG